MRGDAGTREPTDTRAPFLLRWMAAAAALGMFLVLVMGTWVTNTGSGKGCAGTWPLCRGQFIPQFAVGTMIEWSHRTVTGIEGLLIVGLTIGVARLYWRRREIQLLAPAMILFLLLQSVLGMLAANIHEIPAALALHFGISLIAFATVLLTAAFVWELDGRERVRDRPVAPALRGLIWGTLAYSYVVIYLGAYVRHTSASLACGVEWPLCNGTLLPAAYAPMIAQFAHRVAAAGAVLVVVALWSAAWRTRAQRPDLYRGSLIALAAVLLQALSGALVILSRLDVFATLLHGALVSVLFGALAYLALHTLRRPSMAQEPATRSRALAATR